MAQNPEITKLPIDQLQVNPDNPRVIKDFKYKQLVKSLKDFPEMAEVREIVVNKEHVILGGNMRYRAMQEAGWKEVPVKVVDWPPEKQKEFVIKDNLSGGEWDWNSLANEWEAAELKDWGLDTEPYSPDYEPELGIKAVTKEQIEKRAKEMAEQMVKDRPDIEVICPECGHEFKVS